MKKLLIYAIMVLVLCSIALAAAPTKLIMNMDGDVSNGYGVFDDSDEGIRFANSASLDITGNQITLLAWVNFHENGGDIPHNSIITKGDFGGGTGDSYNFYYNTNPNLLQCVIRAGSTTYTTNGGSGLTPDEWHLVACTYDGTTIKTWIDGNVVGSATTGGENINSVSDYVYVSDPGWFAANGSIDDASIYNSALTQEQIQSIYEKGVTSNNDITSGRVLYLDFEGDIVDSSGSGNTANVEGDVSISGSHSATVYGNPVLEGSSPFNTTGGSMNFDGDGDYLTIPDSDAWNMNGEQYTVDFRIKLNSFPATYKQGVILTQPQDGNNFFVFSLYNHTDDTYWWYLTGWEGSGAYPFNNGAVIPSPELNKWYHVAYVKNGSSWKIYHDGQYIGSVNQGNPVPEMTDDIMIGNQDGDLGVNYVPLDASIDEFRITKGLARWTSNFDPPTEPYSTDENTTLLLHFDGDKSIGKVAKFDGDGDYVNLGTDDTLKITGPLTLSSWIKYDETFTDGKGIVSKYDSTINKRAYMLMVSDASYNKASLVIVKNGVWDSAAKQLDGTTNLNDGSWHHVVGTYEPSNHMRIYVDGVLENSLTSGVPSSIYGDSGIPALIGASLHGGVAANIFNGSIDEVRIYNDVLTTEEISTLYSAGLDAEVDTISDTNLVSYYNFEGDYDDKAGNNDATPAGNVSFSRKNEIKFMGTSNNPRMNSTNYKFDSSYYFDGNDYIMIGDSPDFELKEEDFTIDFWIYPDGSQTNYNGVLSSNIDGDPYWSTGDNNYLIYFAESNKLQLLHRNGANDVQLNISSFPLNSWSHVAFVRDGNTLTSYLDGTEKESMDVTGKSFESDNSLGLGKEDSRDDYYFKGYLDDFRITKGLARWTEDFTPKTTSSSQPVTATTFSEESTDLTSLDLSYVENLKLAKSNANIQWNNVVDIDGADLDSYVKIDDNFVSIDAANLDSSLNSSANITLNVGHCNGLTLYYAPSFYTTQEDILTNGQPCNYSSSPSCKNIVCNDGVVTFEVEHFDSYTGSSGAPVPEFQDYAIILAIALTLTGLTIIRKK